VFGTIGSGGAVLLIILALFLHKKGGGRLKPVKNHHVVYWGFALGQLATSVSNSLAHTISNSVQGMHISGVGVAGPGAAAVALIMVAFGTDPKFGKDLICGVAAPGVFATSGIDLLGWAVTLFSGLLHGVVG